MPLQIQCDMELVCLEELPDDASVSKTVSSFQWPFECLFTNDQCCSKLHLHNFGHYLLQSEQLVPELR